MKREKYRGFLISVETDNRNHFWSVQTTRWDLIEIGKINKLLCSAEQALEDAKTAVDCYLINVKIATWQKVIEIEAEKRAR